LKADLFLLHAPSVYDFRERDDILFAYLSDSDSVNVTSVFEMFPLGFFSIKQQLQESGFKTEIVNLASLMLMYPEMDVDKLLSRLEAPVFGIDLHWMAHCHGAIEIARRLRVIQPKSLIVFGGISATYYASQLIQYACVDVVVKGYDTLAPLTLMMQTVKRGGRNFDHIPNLVYKRNNSEVVSTGFTHKPLNNYNDVTVDWSFYRRIKESVTSSKLIMTLPNTGCAYDCSWCGGSRFSYSNIMGIRKTLVAKDSRHIISEMRTLSEAARTTSIYALQCYSEPRARFYQFLDAVKELGYKSVFFEQFQLPDQETLEKMGKSTQSYIMLSPESHDPVVSKLAGRGNYTMVQMEEWIWRAFDAGIAGVMVWFFIGMPRQTTASVFDTVTYCETLLKKFRGKRVIPLICPMVPFLDPGSRFFEEPDKHGYRVFHRTLEQHRRAMVEPVWHRRLNYETLWMSRRDIQGVTYEAIAKLVMIKGELGVLPSSFCEAVLKTIDETKFILTEMERALELDGKLPGGLREVVREYNRKILAYSSDQIIPLPRPFGKRWFDDYTVPRSLISDLK
jgi:clorobiocin biosynthesis protein CloN6